MGTITLPTPFVIFLAGFLMGSFMTLGLLGGRGSSTPTIVVENRDDGEGCGTFMVMVLLILVVFALVVLFGFTG